MAMLRKETNKSGVWYCILSTYVEIVVAHRMRKHIDTHRQTYTHGRIHVPTYRHTQQSHIYTHRQTLTYRHTERHIHVVEFVEERCAKPLV